MSEKSAICRITLRPVLDDVRVDGVLGCVVDVTDLRSLANTDARTGVDNRRSILELLSATVEDAHGFASAMFIDLDNFKNINGRLGHGVGERLLMEVAGRLQAAIRPTDSIGRIGGDEFLVVCPGARTVEDAEAVAGRLKVALATPFEISGCSLSMTASIGVACGFSGVAPERLVSIADEAMYCAKSSG